MSRISVIRPVESLRKYQGELLPVPLSSNLLIGMYSFAYMIRCWFLTDSFYRGSGEQGPSANQPGDPVDHQLSQRRQELQLQWEEARLRRYMAITEAFIRQGGRAPDLSMLSDNA